MRGSLDGSKLRSLRDAFSGALFLPDDTGYEEARSVYNGLIDARPSLIARCGGTDDIVRAVTFARDHGLEISIRGGGHGVAGRAVTDGGLMIDLSSMNDVRVDPDARIARAQGGATWGMFNNATAEHGLATTGGFVSTTGIAGLTLGGGFGYLMGRHGLACDNLRSVELVTADGEVLTASDDENADLFWALRGAGANFGVAVWLEYRLHALDEVTGGLVAHPFESAADVLRYYRDYCDGCSDELASFAGLAHAPDGSGAQLASIFVCHAGDAAAADVELKPLLDFGNPVISEIARMPYPVINTMFDEAYPAGSLNYWKSSFMRELSDAAIDAMLESFPFAPSTTTSIGVEHHHGASTRVGVGDTAATYRDEGFNYLLTSVWTDPAMTDANIAWSRSTYSAMEPHFAERRYVNYLSADDVVSAGPSVFGPNIERLAELKARYDPENLFHLNQNILPRAL